MPQSTALDPRRNDPNWINPNLVEWQDETLGDMRTGDLIVLTGTPDGMDNLKAGDIGTVVAYDHWGHRQLFLFTDGTLVFLDSTDPAEKYVQQGHPSGAAQPHFEVYFDTAGWNEGFEIGEEPLASIPVDDAAGALTQAEKLTGQFLPNDKEVEIKVTYKWTLAQPLPVNTAVMKALEMAIAHCDFAP